MRDLGLCDGLGAVRQIAGDVAGRVVIDIGSGDGALARSLAEAGAEVSGFDPLGPEQAWTNAGAGRYRLLRAGVEALPMADASVDLVLFIYSLHHIPPAVLPAVLAESRRVLRSTGQLYIAEPLAEGPVHQVAELYHDETAVRQQAADLLAANAPRLFRHHDQLHYRNRRSFAGFDDYATRMMASLRFNDFTEAQLRAPAVCERFDAVFQQVGGLFDQPVRVDLLLP